MRLTQRINAREGAGPQARPLGVRIAGALTAFAAFGVFVLVILPSLPHWLSVREQVDFIKKSGIRAGAIYYTDVEEVPAIEARIGAAMRDAYRQANDQDVR